LGATEQQHDSRDLAQFGYKQELHRTLGGFSSFAAGFSYISILTGMFQTSFLGFAYAGAGFVWTWPVVFLGQMAVALQFAELAAHYPLAGSVYNWTKRVASPGWAWNTGWIYLIMQLMTIPAVAIGWQVSLPPISSTFQFIHCTVPAGTAAQIAASSCPTPTTPGIYNAAYAQNGLLLGAVMILLTTTINIAGVRVMSLINNIGVLAELIGATGLVILFAIHIQRSPHILFTSAGIAVPYQGRTLGYLGALLIGAIMPLYVMYGFDTAGSLAEETSDPRRRAPKALIQALCTAGLLGMLLICFGTMAVSKAGIANLSVNGLQGITFDVLGTSWGKFFLVDVSLAIFVCCLAIHAMAVRILFAMGRDNSLPAGRALASVSGSRRVPIVPAVFAGLFAIAELAVNIGNPRAFAIIISMGIIFCYFAYGMTNAGLFQMRQRGWPDNLPDRQDNLFRLGGWGRPLCALAILWEAFVIINLEWPRPDYYGVLWYQKYGPMLITLIVFALGIAYWFGAQKNKVEVLKEHRAEAAVSGD
jgi:urea carboxylase system permease